MSLPSATAPAVHLLTWSGDGEDDLAASTAALVAELRSGAALAAVALRLAERPARANRRAFVAATAGVRVLLSFHTEA